MRTTDITRPQLEAALIFYPDGTMAGLAPDQLTTDEDGTRRWTISLDAMQQTVDGEIEILNLAGFSIGRYIDRDLAMQMSDKLSSYVLILNEDGKRLGLMPNPMATQLMGGEDVAVGTVILCPIRYIS